MNDFELITCPYCNQLTELDTEDFSSNNRPIVVRCMDCDKAIQVTRIPTYTYIVEEFAL